MSPRLRFETTTPTSLGDLLEPLGEADAAAEGRAFVNGKRAEPGTGLKPGDWVEVYGPRRGAEQREAVVLAAKGGLLVAEKPAGLPTTAEQRGSRSLVQLLEEQLGEAVHPASRLDVGVSGVVLCALGPRATKHVAQAKERGQVRRVYVGLAALAGLDAVAALTPAPRALSGLWDSPISDRPSRLRGAPPPPGGAPARTRWSTVAIAPPLGPRGSATSLLRLEPLTGRKHQLRIHAARAGAPLLGDGEYGGPTSLVLPSGSVRRVQRVALHALSVSLPDLDGRTFTVTAPVPPDLRELWSSVGGEDSSWAAAEVRGLDPEDLDPS
jgi:23S rRNA pseudouridine1911/1915/1917 synthase